MIYVKTLPIRQIVPKIVLHGQKKANRKKTLNCHSIPVDSNYVQVHLRKIYEVFMRLLLFQFQPKNLLLLSFTVFNTNSTKRDV